MRELDGWFILFQPRYRIPSVFDLHSRGLFSDKPSVTQSYGARLLVNDRLQVALEYRLLKEKRGVSNGVLHAWATEQGILVLQDDMSLDCSAVAEVVGNDAAGREINKIYEQFCKDYMHVDSDRRIDIPALERKLLASLSEAKRLIREELKLKNGKWVASRVPALSGQFFRWQEGKVAEDLFDAYLAQGGVESESTLITKVAQFYTISDTKTSDGLERFDGGKWTSEDEIWECWVGFAGSEDEARRIVQAMEKVFRSVDVS